MSQPEFSFSFKAFDVEAHFAKRLADHGKRVFEGATDPQLRKERIRQAIIESRMDCTVIGRNAAGKPETYAQLFERHFGEPLQPIKRKGKRHVQTAI
jgi:hypothetical protein